MKCKKCGTEYDGKFCPNCGETNEEQPNKKAKKPIVKKWWFWLIIVVVLVIIISSALGGGSGNKSDTAGNTTASGETISSQDSNSNLGDYKIVIKDATTAKDYTGKDVAIVTVSYTNNSSEPAAFDVVFEDHAYQNGIEAEHSYYLGTGDYDDSNNASKEIKQGATIDVKIAYDLNDLSTPLEVEIGQWFSFDSTKITKTFNF